MYTNNDVIENWIMLSRLVLEQVCCGAFLVDITEQRRVDQCNCDPSDFPTTHSEFHGRNMRAAIYSHLCASTALDGHRWIFLSPWQMTLFVFLLHAKLKKEINNIAWQWRVWQRSMQATYSKAETRIDKKW